MSKQTKFTPWPWVLGKTTNDGGRIVQSANLNGDGDYVADVFDARDAHIIAASPELYMALLTVADGFFESAEEMRDVARAALAKVS